MPKRKVKGSQTKLRTKAPQRKFPFPKRRLQSNIAELKGSIRKIPHGGSQTKQIKERPRANDPKAKGSKRMSPHERFRTIDPKRKRPNDNFQAKYPKRKIPNADPQRQIQTSQSKRSNAKEPKRKIPNETSQAGHPSK